MIDAMYDEDKAERRKEKKIRRILKKSAWATGLGVGLLILKVFIVPYIGDNEQAEKALSVFSWCLVFYGITMILSFLFLRAHIFKINIALSWVILPLLFVKLLMDVL
ncbi:MAG: hypothetical protein H6867_03410 [Rhodospirillales bacterium]|nr:hypothetical protein [Rhodospirillales bacterium]MCB9996200.1 hypothetical protein [Rhodospirillales bacterium]